MWFCGLSKQRRGFAFSKLFHSVELDFINLIIAKPPAKVNIQVRSARFSALSWLTQERNNLIIFTVNTVAGKHSAINRALRT